MKAQTLAISIPNKGCDKNCPYCISKITPNIKTDETLFIANLKKAETLANNANVSSILLTGKGEPFLNDKYVERVLDKFRHYPIEIQTNGIKLYKLFKEEDIPSYIFDINVIAFSIDTSIDIQKYEDLFHFLNKMGIVVRVTFNISDEMDDMNFNNLVILCNQAGVKQLTLRNITLPEHYDEDNKQVKWIKEHCITNYDGKEVPFYGYYEKILKQIKYNLSEKLIIRELLFGAKVYSYKGLALTFFDYCVQETNNNEDIRTLIYQEDGHMYTSWNDPASILF